jgi:hypothetical protein
MTMAPMATAGQMNRTAERGRRNVIVAVTGGIAAVLVVLLLLEALLEGWLLMQLRTAGPEFADLVRAIRNGAYVGLGLSAGLHVAVSGRARVFWTVADATFVVLMAIMVLAGALGGSSPTLIGEAVFVYMRGAVIFYALRALEPPPWAIRSLLLALGLILCAHAIAAVAQAIVGPSGYGAFGITDLGWAVDGRAQGLFTHPNHLGHVAGFGLIGIVAWRLSRISARWWLLVGLLATALGLSRSWESIAATLLALVALWLLRGRTYRAIVMAIAAIAIITGASLMTQPGALASIADKFNGVVRAIDIPSGTEASLPPSERCDPASADCTATGVPKRSTRLLLYQQGIDAWTRSPLFGYGVGQFGGGVASQHDPLWYLDKRFGPDAFNLYGMDLTQADSFWLHLLVETGAIGLITYLIWLAALVYPSARRVFGTRLQPSGRDGLGPPLDRWAIRAVLFAFVIAFFSPSLEDPMFPALLFGVLGLAWSRTQDGRRPVGEAG